MTTRFMSLLLALACGAAAQTADDAHARKLADIHKLMAITGGDKVAEQMFDAIGSNLRAAGGANNANLERFLQEFKKEVDFKQVMDVAAESYDQHLSGEDVRALIAFYQSPAGKHMLLALPRINADMIARIMPMSQEIAQKVMKRMREEGEK